MSSPTEPETTEPETTEPGTTEAPASATIADPLAGRAVAPDDVLRLLQGWVPEQRWYPAKGTDVVPEQAGVVVLTDPQGEADIALHLLRMPSGGVLQVPVVVRTDDGDSDEQGLAAPGTDTAQGQLEEHDALHVRSARPGLIGRLLGAGDGAPARLVVDGCHDPAFLRAWLAAAHHDVPVAADLTGAQVLSGEQSNTSVLLPASSPPAILKVFRGISPGPNPDVEVPLALSRVGWTGVPRPLAWLTGSWPADPDVGSTGTESGHLGVLSELVPEAEDGFRLACRYAGEGQDLGDLAEDLGRTTAQMHRALRTALPVGGAAGRRAQAADVVAALRRRAAAAVEAAPVLAGRAARIESVHAALEQLMDLPPVQRVHGDYHLGQVLRSATAGWAVLDFEGEPQAPVEERTRPDLALRDLAGMLRSIDYAAAVGGAAAPAWASTARARLVQGYRTEADGASGDADDAGAGATSPATTDALLRALELDKALYEVVYESRNRPTWLPIPLEGVDRLLDQSA